MLVVDTSAWIEWLQDTPLGQQLGHLFPSPVNCLVPTMVSLELGKWAIRNGGAAQLRHIERYTSRCRIEVLDRRIAKRAALMHRRLRLATADAVIYATARSHGVQLLTCDAHFANLPAVMYFPKA